LSSGLFRAFIIAKDYCKEGVEFPNDSGDLPDQISDMGRPREMFSANCPMFTVITIGLCKCIWG
jgi:hypothetical protein